MYDDAGGYLLFVLRRSAREGEIRQFRSKRYGIYRYRRNTFGYVTDHSAYGLK